MNRKEPLSKTPKEKRARKGLKAYREQERNKDKYPHNRNRKG